MADEKTPDLEIMNVYAMMWRLLHMNVTLFGSYPTGELLVVLTITLLADAGYHPTVTELADLTGLPKSTVSRYVSTEMNLGYIEEVIDPNDRRRRLLHATESARSHRDYYRQEIHKVVQDARVVFAEMADGERPGAGLKEMLQRLAKPAD